MGKRKGVTAALITSSSNQKIKNIMALRQKAKERRTQQSFIVEGHKMFLEAPIRWIREVYISESFLAKCSFKDRLEQTGYEVVADDVFRRAADTQTPQGILSILQTPHYELDALLTKEAPLLVALEDLQDPGNLGTILRAAEGAGVDGVIMTRDTVDIFNPKVIRATMGSIYRLPFYQTDNLTDTIYTLKNKGIQVYAAHLEDSVCYDEADYTKGTAFLIGNEGSGLKRETADAATRYIKIPMQGQVESLNAAIATSILMYEAARQRKQ